MIDMANFKLFVQIQAISISYRTHARAITDIIDRGKIRLPEQWLRAQPETVRG